MRRARATARANLRPSRALARLAHGSVRSADQAIGSVLSSKLTSGDPRDVNLQQEEKPMNNERQKPVHEIRLGLVRASIWENKSEFGVRHNVTSSGSIR